MLTTLDTYDALLERAVLALYLRWPFLLRRTTLPALEHLRRDLAGALRNLAVHPDLPRFQALAGAFARRSLELPGVHAIAGADLAKLAGAPAARSGFFISNASVTAERLRDLAMMLESADPPAYAIGCRVYRTSLLPQAWDDIRPAIEPILERLPPGTTSVVASIDQDLQAALDQTTRFDVRPYATALLRLEAIPGLVAILVDRFARWKSVTQETTLAVATPRHSEPAAESAEPASLDRELAAPASLPAPEEIEVNFHTDVKFPARLQRNKVEWLIIRLRLEKPAETAAAGLVAVEFTKQGNEPPSPEYLAVRVLAPDVDEETRMWERTITVHHDRDSDPAVFLLKSSELGKKRITIDFYHKERLVGSAWFMTEVVDMPASSASVTITRSPDDLPEFARFERNPPPPADVQLRVVKKSSENRLAFWLNSTHPDLPYSWEQVGEIELTSQNPMAFLAKLLEPLDDMVTRLSRDLTQDERTRAAEELNVLAEGLFEQLLPEQFRVEYFTRIQPLQQAGKIKSMLITSDEPWIPWELLKPYYYSVSEDKEYVAKNFWSLDFQLARWLAGRGPAALVAVQEAALVLPDVGLPAVAQEQAFFNSLAAARAIHVSGPAKTLDEVKSLFLSGGYQIMHVATHGRFDTTDADASVLELSDENLRPADLVASRLRGIRQSRPLVFLNACDGGRADFSLTGLGGWAEKLFREANASAFVGALWEVHDDLAVEFTKHFYSRLVAGDSIGEAMRAARVHLYQIDSTNPTWLAYTLYGDPNTVVRIGVL